MVKEAEHMKTRLRRSGYDFSLRVFVVAVILFGGLKAYGTGGVDPSFNAVTSKTLINNGAKGQIVQPDGKHVLWGGEFVVDGQAKGQIVRLNSDGSVDNTFNYCGCLLSNVGNVGLQPDGKLLVGGVLSSQAKIIRLNPDGSPDGSFSSSGFGGFQYSEARFVALQPDGKVLVSINGSTSGYHQGYVARLNPDGSTDAGFTLISYDGGRLIHGYLRSLALAPAGKLYLAVTVFSGGTSSTGVRRYNADGTADSTWEAPVFAGGSFPVGLDVMSLAIQTDGSLLAGGRFDTVNGVVKTNFVRLMPAGNVDLAFSPPVLSSSVSQIGVLQSGKILVTSGLLARLNTDGSQDGTFTHPPTVSSVLNQWVIDSSERILFLGQSDQFILRYYRLNPNGNVDAAFSPNVGEAGSVYSLARQADGKVVLAGTFNRVNTLARASFARVNTDGTSDATFDPGSGFDSPPTTLLIQSDGKILALGTFTTYNGTAKAGLARINSDGSLDTSFAPDVTSVFGIALQGDGKILIAGSFTTVNGLARALIARLNLDGSTDATFNSSISSGSVYSFLQQTDGKFIVGGAFTGVDGFNRSNLVRLNSNGSLDQTFNAGSVLSVNSITIRPDGKYFCVFGAGQPTTMGRRNSDGTVDAGFISPTFSSSNSSDLRLNSVIVQTDGSILVGGNFDRVGSTFRHYLVRLNSVGALDQLFFPNGPSLQVRAMIGQPDEKVVIGGDFSRVEGSNKAGIARIVPGVFTKVTNFDYDGDGKADVSVFRPSNNYWYQLRSSDSVFTYQNFGANGDIAAPADYDGDGRTDLGIFRPSSGDWWYKSSIDGVFRFAHWGGTGDVPRPSDFDADGKADYVAFRPTTNTWYRMSSSSGITSNQYFGDPGDKPLIGDFDGDGKSDPAIFRPSTGVFWYLSSIDSVHRAIPWGAGGDVPAPGDYDGDGKTDAAVYRLSTGFWYIRFSGNGAYSFTQFGISEDKPVPADYDGDGKADIAVFRPSTGVWYLLRSSQGFAAIQFGANGDIPTPNSFVP